MHREHLLRQRNGEPVQRDVRPSMGRATNGAGLADSLRVLHLHLLRLEVQLELRHHVRLREHHNRKHHRDNSVRDGRECDELPVVLLSERIRLHLPLDL